MLPVRAINNSKLPVVLSNAETCKYLGNLNGLIPLLEESLCDFSKSTKQGKATSKNSLINPLRTAVRPDSSCFYMAMPVYYGRSGVFTCKMVTSVTPESTNDKLPALPVLNAVLALFDSITGHPLAFMEAEEITGFRTAAVSFIAAKHLLKTKPETIAILGTGTQAAAHVQVYATLFKPKVISVWGIDFASSESFCKRWGSFCEEKSVVLKPALTAVEACLSAQLITTVTSSPVPILPRNAVGNSCGLIIIVGAPTKDAQEAETKVLQDCMALYADSKEAASNESGDVINSGREINAELGEIISGEKETVKKAEGKANYAVFKSQGLAVEDAVTSKFIYDRYKESYKNGH